LAKLDANMSFVQTPQSIGLLYVPNSIRDVRHCRGCKTTNDQRIKENKTVLEKQRQIVARSKEKMEATMTAYKQCHRAEYYAGKFGNAHVEGGHLLPERFPAPLAELPKLLQFEEKMGKWSEALAKINSDTNVYLSSRVHAQHLSRKSGEPIVGGKQNMAEVVSGGVGKMQRMEPVSYARGSKTVEAAMDSVKTDQHDVKWKYPDEKVGGYRGRDSNYDPNYYGREARYQRRDQEHRD
jgi:hypothetical protein